MSGTVWLWVLLAAKGAAGATDGADSETWVGHYIQEGLRKVPLSGQKQVHTETFVIAQVHRSGDQLNFIESVCRIEVRPVKKVTVTMSPATIAHLPPTKFTLNVQDGQISGPAWTSGWGTEDVEDDGHPGATVHVGGTFCSGDLYISNQTRTSLTSGKMEDSRLSGLVSGLVRQRVLGADGICLRTMVGDSEEVQMGTLAYARVEDGTTCQSLGGKPWPVHAAPVKGTQAK
jgi:hypothetical protein